MFFSIHSDGACYARTRHYSDTNVFVGCPWRLHVSKSEWSRVSKALTDKLNAPMGKYVCSCMSRSRVSQPIKSLYTTFNITAFC